MVRPNTTSRLTLRSCRPQMREMRSSPGAVGGRAEHRPVLSMLDNVCYVNLKRERLHTLGALPGPRTSSLGRPTPPPQIPDRAERVQADQAPEQLAATNSLRRLMLDVSLRRRDQAERYDKHHEGRKPLGGRFLRELLDRSRHELDQLIA
jgi:hypothetical protein